MKEIVYYQNIANFVISIIVCINLYYYYYVDKTTVNYSIPIIFTHFCVDFPFAKNDIKIHHLFGIMITFFKYFYNVVPADDAFVIISLYKTEISTLFYVVKLWNTDNYIQKTYKLPKTLFVINDLLFFITFFKFRIFDYYINVISNSELYLSLNKYTSDSIFKSIFLYSGIHGYFYLNLYWFLIICKIMTKIITKNMSKKTLEFVCHKIVSYTFYLNIFVAVYVYSYFPNQSYMFDVAGIIFLSIYSYKYHDKVVNFLSNNELLEYSSYDIILPFLQDKFAIHIRSICCVITSSFYNKEIFSLLLISSILHISSYTSLLMFFYDIKKNDNKIFYDNSKTTEYFLIITNTLSIIPIIFDSSIVAYNSYDLIKQIDVFFITILTGLILKMNPFYDLSHIFVHICLTFQTYFMCKCNIR